MWRREVSSGVGRGAKTTRLAFDSTLITFPYLFTRIPMGSVDRADAHVKGVSYVGRCRGVLAVGS